MYCLGKDYLEFIKKYRYYLQLDMKEYVNDDEYIEKSLNRELFTPKGIIDNLVVWNFNHHKDAQTAIEKWNAQRKRVNFDNIAVIMMIQCDEDAYEFEKIDIRKKVGIYYKNLNLKNVVYCPLWQNIETRYQYGGNWLAMANAFACNSRGCVAKIDWLKFLNGEENYLRY